MPTYSSGERVDWQKQREKIADNARLIEQFKNADVKIALPAAGLLHEVAQLILKQHCGLALLPPLQPQVPIAVSEEGVFGVLYAEHKDIGSLVQNGAVDMAVMSSDCLVEEGLHVALQTVETYEELASWPIALASPRQVEKFLLRDVRRIATPYPVITRNFLTNFSGAHIEITKTTGSALLQLYVRDDVDAVIDVVSSNELLQLHQCGRCINQPLLGVLWAKTAACQQLCNRPILCMCAVPRAWMHRFLPILHWARAQPN